MVTYPQFQCSEIQWGVDQCGHRDERQKAQLGDIGEYIATDPIETDKWFSGKGVTYEK